jgi:hypothetical protein
MTTHQPAPHPRPPTGLRKIGSALGALVAIAITILFLAFTSAQQTVHVNSTAHHHPTPAHAKPNHHPRRGGCRAVLDPMTGQMHGGCPPE